MKNSIELSETWLKASILGTTWAASEIVLGSFLHNVRMPFSGNILTAIGLIILISASYKWKNRGLIWRAGLICALMKSISPSAMIFGPMIAIFAESVLLELSTRILGRTTVGFLVGASLAMTWVLFQRIFNFIIFYGFNIVAIYTNLMKFAEKQLNLKFDIVWLPIVVLLGISILFGIFSAMMGMKAGKQLLKQPVSLFSQPEKQTVNQPRINKPDNFTYSLLWLIFDIVLMVGALYLLNTTAWYIWSTTITLIIGLWSFRYKNALRQLSKPKFWIYFILITLLTAYIFTSLQDDPKSLINALNIGMAMNFRAAIMIVGFSVLGKELYNPRIRDYFYKTSFRNLPLALELSFESLPFVIGNLPDIKTILRKPLETIQLLIAQAEFRLSELQNNTPYDQQVFIVTGKLAEGKTTFLKELYDLLNEKKISTGGFLAHRVMDKGTTVGYDLEELNSHEKYPFLRDNGKVESPRFRRFYIDPKGLSRGVECLKPDANRLNQAIIIDEVGRMELADEGWSQSITDLLSASCNHLIMAARTDFVEAVIEKWHLKQVIIIDISKTTASLALTRIVDQIGVK